MYTILCSCGQGQTDWEEGVEFLIGWCDFSLVKDYTWEPTTNLPGWDIMCSHMMSQFNKHWEEEYKMKSTGVLLWSIWSDNTSGLCLSLLGLRRDSNSVGLVKSDLWGHLLDTTLIDVMWVKGILPRSGEVNNEINRVSRLIIQGVCGTPPLNFF